MPRQIVFIMTDSTRFDMVGCYGNSAMHTPCIDALAESGVRFGRAYTTQPVCGPARSALFTGQYPHSNGSWGNTMPLGADVQTLGQRLSAQGIPCAYVGKWHLDAGDYFGYGQCPEGWDPAVWYDMRNYLEELTDDERFLSRQAEATEGKGIEEGFTFGYRCTQRALDYLDRAKEGDFFLVVSYDEPHGPSLCPEPYASMYKDYEWPKTPAHYDTLEGKPLSLQLWAGERRERDREALRIKWPLFFGCNSFIDSQIGRVVEKVRQVAPDALIVFTSDHGDALESHCLYAKGPTVCDDIARVPLILAGGGCPEGSVYPHTVSHIDLPATVLDYMGLSRPKVFEGVSLMPRARGEETQPDAGAFVEFGRYEIDHDGFGGFQPMRAIVTDRFKLALHLLDGDEFYDLEKDPYECVNRISDPEYAQVRDALHDRIIAWMNDTRDPFRGYQWQCRPWRTGKTPSWDVDGYTRQRDNESGEYRQLDYNTGLPMKESVRYKC